MITLDHIDEKAASSLEGYLVRKDLVRTFSRQFPVPTYVVEFLLGRYCASIDSSHALSKPARKSCSRRGPGKTARSRLLT